jgi:hypothetical protein
LTPKFHYLQIQGAAAPRCSLLFVGIPQSIACRAAKQNDSEEEDGRGHRIDCDGVVGNARSSFETKDKGAAADNYESETEIHLQKLETICRVHHRRPVIEKAVIVFYLASGLVERGTIHQPVPYINTRICGGPSTKHPPQ